jgi:hypothetical protein
MKTVPPMLVFNRHNIIFSILCLIGPFALAQESDVTFTLKAGVDVTKAIPFENRYMYKEFSDGRVYFRNGKTTGAKLNYNTIFAQIQFVGPRKDTLLLADMAYIDTITIGKDVYYYLEGYGHIRRIGGTGKTLLGKIYSLSSLGSEKAVSYGQYSQTSAVDGYSSYTDGDGRMRNLTTNDQTRLRGKSRFFWIDANKRITLATKANLFRIFPKEKKKLGVFIDQHNIDFTNEQDLSRLLTYAESIQSH